MGEPVELQPSRKRPFTFSTRDILIMVTLALVLGVITIPIQLASVTLNVAAPVAQRLLSGAYLIGPLLGGFIFRRYGVAFLIPLLSSLVWIATSAFGFTVLLLGFFLGIYCEIGMWIGTRYRHFGQVHLMIAGIMAGTCSFVISGFLFGLQNVPLWLSGLYWIMQMIGGGAAGLLAFQFAQALKRTGMLNNMPFVLDEYDEI
ncbi:MAG: ECF transporter S component [Chloroflexota bacterium]